ncbi:MAG: nucleotidyltransferase family protein [Planctomycetota bacterium]|nr:nucleotidyltransferase family protein [Planctomycetota bacterium]
MKDLAKRPSEALILAGGLGSRLRPAVADVPKPMAPAGSRPFLEYLLDYWLARGIARFVVSVGYLAERIMDHFGSGYRGAQIEYVRETEPLGTGGALALALEKTAWRSGSILLLNGDTWLAASLDRLAADADRQLPATLVLVRVEANDRYGGVEVDAAGRVVRFGLPADGGPALVNAGCCLLRPEPIQAALAGLPRRFSLERDLLPGLARQGRVAASVQAADFIDIGVAEDYRRFCREFAGAGFQPRPKEGC